MTARLMTLDADVLYIALLMCGVVGILIGSAITMYVMESRCPWCSLKLPDQTSHRNGSYHDNEEELPSSTS